MQYFVSVVANGTESAAPGEDAAIDAFNDRLRAQGYWVFANGLADPSTATVVDGRGEEPVFTDGPFLESKEFLAGFWLIDVPNLDVAEEAAAEAFATAVERWPADGVPPNPGAWLTTTAARKAIDRLRRENKRDDKQKEAETWYDDRPVPLDAIEDERLRLIFTCCHPALAMEARIALTLRMVGGLTVPEIARAFLVPES